MLRKKSSLLTVLTPFVLALALFVPSIATAATTDQIAKTAPPPPEMIFQPFGFFDGSHTYLLTGSNTLSYTTDNKADFSCYTMAYNDVSIIGYSMQLQRWTGTNWFNIGTFISGSENNSDFVYGTGKRDVAYGYYYRVVSSHFTTQGTIYESGTIYGTSLLASK